MVGCAAAQRIIGDTRDRVCAECTARDGFVDRKGETRFQNETDSAGGITAISGISGRICLRCGRSECGRVWQETNLGDAAGLQRHAAAITRKIYNRLELRASVTRVRRLDLEYSEIEGRFRPDRSGTLHSHPG